MSAYNSHCQKSFDTDSLNQSVRDAMYTCLPNSASFVHDKKGFKRVLNLKKRFSTHLYVTLIQNNVSNVIQ